MSGWATVMVSSDAVAERILDSAGYEVYAPRYRAILRGARLLPSGRRVRSRTDTVIYRPLFSGYLFVLLDENTQWDPIRKSLHVRRIIMSEDETPVLLRSEIIEQLRMAEADGLWDEVTAVEALRTEIASGKQPTVSVPWYGVMGKLVSLDDSGRARVLIEMLGSTTLTVDGRTLRLVQA